MIDIDNPVKRAAVKELSASDYRRILEQRLEAAKIIIENGQPVSDHTGYIQLAMSEKIDAASLRVRGYAKTADLLNEIAEKAIEIANL